MIDHDQRFKEILREFFPDFLRLFLPRWAARFDLSNVEWLTQEVFPDPPAGRRAALDLVAKVPRVGGGTTLALIHTEVESGDSVAELRRRMFYYSALRQRHELPVLPVALYLESASTGWVSTSTPRTSRNSTSCGSGIITSGCRRSTPRRTPPAKARWAWRSPR